MNAIDVAKKADKFVDLAYEWVKKSWGFKAEAEYARLALRDALIAEFSAHALMEAQDAEMDGEIEREMTEEASGSGDRAWSVFNICAERDAAVAERDELRAKLTAMEAASGEPVAWGMFKADGTMTGHITDHEIAASWKPEYGFTPGEYVAPLYTHTAPLPAYVPMTDEKLMDKAYGLAKYQEESLELSGWVEYGRAIEQAVLARLGVPHD